MAGCRSCRHSAGGAASLQFQPLAAARAGSASALAGRAGTRSGVPRTGGECGQVWQPVGSRRRADRRMEHAGEGRRHHAGAGMARKRRRADRTADAQGVWLAADRTQHRRRAQRPAGNGLSADRSGLPIHNKLTGANHMTDGQTDGKTGLRVLIVEDEPLVTMLLEGMMEDLGHSVLGPFLRLEPALEFIQANHREIDVAILDVNLGGIRSFAAADLLLELGVPFVFASGYDEAGIDERWRMWPNIGKLFYEDELKAILEKAAAEDRRSIARSRQGSAPTAAV